MPLIESRKEPFTERIRRARAFATVAHQTQTRRYSGRPYIEHPVAVARMVTRFQHDEDMLIAALLHDAVEDTPVTLSEIEFEFGVGVAGLVSDLTDVSQPADGNRATRKYKDLIHTSVAQPRAKTVKLMDLVHNAVSIVRHDRGFAVVFLDEMNKMLDVLQDASDSNAWLWAQRVYVRSRFRLLGLGDHPHLPNSKYVGISAGPGRIQGSEAASFLISKQ